jgi:hypothetical protein
MYGIAEREAGDARTSNWGGLLAMDDSDEEGGDKMAIGEEDAAPSGGEETLLEVFPDPTPALTYGGDMLRSAFPPSNALPPLPPGVLPGLAKVTQLQVVVKRLVGMQLALPMPVHSSPLIALLAPPDVWSARYINWTESAQRLLSLTDAVRTGVISRSPALSVQQADAHWARYRQQTELIRHQQEDRIAELCREGQPLDATLERFVGFLEEYALYYLHTIEHYLFKMMLAPRNVPGLTLAHVLTPNETPAARAGDATTLKCCVDFFTMKMELVRRGQESCTLEDGFVYTPPAPMDIAQLRQEQQHDLYKGYISRRALVDYLRFCDVEYAFFH